jgi:hypothetical protein
MKSDKIRKVAQALKDNTFTKEIHNHPAMIEADNTGNEDVIKTVATALAVAEQLFEHAISNINKVAERYDGQIEESDIDEIAALAEEFDQSGDEFLQKQASVLDQLLVNFSQISGSQAKKAEEDNIDKIRAKYREQSSEEVYKDTALELDKDLKSADVAKAVKEQVKEYRPLEAPLSTRTCPDHPGAQMSRMGDGIYQCSMDNKIYNYNEGFKTMKGNEVPGTSVAGQTQGLGERAIEQTSFSTREENLNFR